jgi:hypothetical protein
MNNNNNSAVADYTVSTSSNTNTSVDGVFAPWSSHAAGLLGSMMQDSALEDESKKSRKKPKDRPKRPLSAYNIFFKEERNRILESLPVQPPKTEDSVESFVDGEGGQKKRRKRKRKGPAPHGKIGFESLAKLIGKRWQELDEAEMSIYKGKAEEDMQRYKREMVEHKERMKEHGSAGSLSGCNSSSLVSGMVPSTGSASNALFDTSLLEPKPIMNMMMNNNNNNNNNSNAMNNNNNNNMSTMQNLMMMQQHLQHQLAAQHQQQSQQQQQQQWGESNNSNNDKQRLD